MEMNLSKTEFVCFPSEIRRDLFEELRRQTRVMIRVPVRIATERALLPESDQLRLSILDEIRQTPPKHRGHYASSL